MFQNISLIGFNLRSEDYLIKLLMDNFEQINVICVEEFNIKEIDGVVSLKAKANNHPLIENSKNSSEYFVDIENEQKTLCLINLPPSFSESISSLVQLDIPKIYNFEEYEVAKTYFFGAIWGSKMPPKWRQNPPKIDPNWLPEPPGTPPRPN